jgi:hypothetical protein
MFSVNRVVSFALLATAAGYTTTALPAVQYVKVCSIYGPNYYYSPGTDTCINSQTGVTKQQTADGTVTSKTALAQSVDDIDNRVARAFESASVATALTSPDLTAGEHFGLRVNWGNAGQSNAIGLTGAAVIGEGLFATGSRLTGTAGIAYAGRTLGGNAGVQLTW